MSLARHNFAKIVPTDKSKLGSRVYSSSQVTNMIKANANTAQPKRYAFGISAFYRVNSGLINDYRTITGPRIPVILDGDVLDANYVLDINYVLDSLILDGDGGGSEINSDIILDGN